MKATGITRPLDPLGRITLPKEIRRSFDMKTGDALEIYTEDNSIVLKKSKVSCIICGNSENVVEFKERCVCVSCIAQIKALP